VGNLSLVDPPHERLTAVLFALVDRRELGFSSPYPHRYTGILQPSSRSATVPSAPSQVVYGNSSSYPPALLRLTLSESRHRVVALSYSNFGWAIGTGIESPQFDVVQDLGLRAGDGEHPPSERLSSPKTSSRRLCFCPPWSPPWSSLDVSTNRNFNRNLDQFEARKSINHCHI
jgi:hypothetical protein